MNAAKLKTRRQFAWLTCLVALAMTLLFQQFYLQAKAKRISDLNLELARIQLKLDADELALAQLQKRVPASVETGLAGQLLEQYLKYNGQFSSVVNGLVSSSKGNAFNLTKILAETQTQGAGYVQTAYSLEAEASFISIGKFLEKMEDSPLLTEVDTIDISRMNNEMKRCKAKIKLFSYVGGK